MLYGQTTFFLNSSRSIVEELIDPKVLENFLLNPQLVRAHPISGNITTDATAPRIQLSDFFPNSLNPTIGPVIDSPHMLRTIINIKMPRSANSNYLTGVIDGYKMNYGKVTSLSNPTAQGQASTYGGLYPLFNGDMVWRTPPFFMYANATLAFSRSHRPAKAATSGDVIPLNIYQTMVRVPNGISNVNGIPPAAVARIMSKHPLLIDYRAIQRLGLANFIDDLVTTITGTDGWEQTYALVDVSDTWVVGQNLVINAVVQRGMGPREPIFRYLAATMTRDDFLAASLIWPTTTRFHYHYETGAAITEQETIAVPVYDFFDHFDSYPTYEQTNVADIPAGMLLTSYFQVTNTLNYYLTALNLKLSGLPIPLSRTVMTPSAFANGSPLNLSSFRNPFVFFTNLNAGTPMLRARPWEFFVVSGGTLSTKVSIHKRTGMSFSDTKLSAFGAGTPLLAPFRAPITMVSPWCELAAGLGAASSIWFDSGGNQRIVVRTGADIAVGQPMFISTLNSLGEVVMGLDLPSIDWRLICAPNVPEVQQTQTFANVFNPLVTL